MDFYVQFTSTFDFVALQDTVSYPRYGTLVTYPPAHLALSAAWCFIPFPGPIHNCPTNWDPNSNPLTNHHLECKDILHRQLSESETPDFHYLLHQPQHPAASIVENSTFRALPCQLPLLPLLLWPIQSQPQPQARLSQTCSANVSKCATRIQKNRIHLWFQIHPSSSFMILRDSHVPSMVHPWSFHCLCFSAWDHHLPSLCPRNPSPDSEINCNIVPPSGSLQALYLHISAMSAPTCS